MENIIADGIVAILFGIFLTWLISWKNRPRPKIIINMEDPSRDGFYWISISIANHGRTPFKVDELNWHLYWPHSVDGVFVRADGSPFSSDHNSFQTLGESIIEGVRHSHFSNFNERPVLPNKDITILRFKLSRPYGPSEIKVRYRFSTNLGNNPKWAWQIWRWKKIDDENGFPRLPLLPMAKIRDIRYSDYRNELFVPPKNLSGKKFWV